MFTKPSLSDLLDGAVKTAENVLRPALEGLPAADVVTGLLMVLDRVQAEWSIATQHLTGSPTVDTAALEQIDLFDHAFATQRLEDFPALTYVVRWLRKHQPVASRVSVIHGDFRLGNFMWDDIGIVAMLDWEQCHLGDPLEEIAFMYWPLWTLEPFIALTEFLARYEQASGIHVDRDALAFYRVFIELKMSVVVLTGIKSFFATADRQLRYGANNGYELLRECQLRVIDELLNR